MSDGPGRGDTGDDAVPVGGGFDAAHLQAVHRHLFDGVDPTHNPALLTGILMFSYA
jgi:hypothetical protein